MSKTKPVFKGHLLYCVACRAIVMMENTEEGNELVIFIMQVHDCMFGNERLCDYMWLYIAYFHTFEVSVCLTCLGLSFCENANYFLGCALICLSVNVGFCACGRMKMK